VTGKPRPVPPVVSMAAFRIVQESLTNVVKHAGARATRVRLAYRPTSVAVTVENDGGPIDPPKPGFGLAGMGERADFVGGTLTAAPLPAGGFRVHAELPTPGAEP
jgi:signal transduction histidine kinase